MLAWIEHIQGSGQNVYQSILLRPQRGEAVDGKMGRSDDGRMGAGQMVIGKWQIVICNLRGGLPRYTNGAGLGNLDFVGGAGEVVHRRFSAGPADGEARGGVRRFDDEDVAIL